jgi:hypothetical protein
MIGMARAKSLYAVPTWTRLVALVTERPSLRAAIAGLPKTLRPYTPASATPTTLRLYGHVMDRCVNA